MQTGGAYERILVANRACLDRGWLPPAAECPELAELRAKHERLLDACDEALAKVSTAREAVDRGRAARSDALRKAILEGRSPASIKLAEPDDAPVRDARRVYDAATEALEQFLATALEQIAELAPQIEDGLAGRQREAEAKRAEARRLLEEADRLAAEPRRLRNWLDRYTTTEDPLTGERRKTSTLGPIPFETMDLPVRVPVPPLFEEIAGLPPATVIGIGSDELTDEEMEAISRA
jgi:hypothetical protein